MKKLILLSLPLMMAMFASSPPTQAGIVVTIGPLADLGGPVAPAADTDTPFGPFNAGASVVLPVYAFDDDPVGSPVNVNSVQLPIDFGANGSAVVGGLSIFQSPGIGASSDFANTPLPTPTFAPGVSGFDFTYQVDNGGTNLVIGGIGAPTKLFDITFTVDPLATSGIYDIIRDGTVPLGPLFTNFLDAGSVSIIEAVSYDNGQIQVIGAAPVPEPSTYAILGLGFAGFGVMRRRKSRPTKHTTV